jgi:hypothetical protein
MQREFDPPPIDQGYGHEAHIPTAAATSASFWCLAFPRTCIVTLVRGASLSVPVPVPCPHRPRFAAPGTLSLVQYANNQSVF